ncbi:MAG TPA: dNTP triphosphohydrolase [Longimicrobium sp.]|nr:dNTP triphosphohydrolase [Longimicrobium sp.]
MPALQRSDRRHTANEPDHARDPWQRDRDRILYSDALQRLANVTQVASPSEGIVFHNRLTHTHEVAQIARRLAERLRAEQPELADRCGLNPDVVEAAALAHDLGHPPFGHIAEEELDRLARANGAPEGFEGNAQSFRIVVRTEPHRIEYRGLDLTRATLNAILKYPWVRDTRAKGADPVKARKFGAYSSEQTEFDFAREGFKGLDEQSIEAAIMDHADAIAYSVHDLDDFYRAGLIPIESLVFGDQGEWTWFSERWKRLESKIPEAEIDGQRDTFLRFLSRLSVGSHYTGEYAQRAHLRTATSRLIDRFVRGVRLVETAAGVALQVEPAHDVQLRFLQALVRVYVINNPRLATQQHGQRQIIRTLFETYLGAIKRRNSDFVPALFREDVARLVDSPEKADPDKREPSEEETRLAVDIVASFTDAQAVLLHKRLTGTAPGSITELLHA